MENLTEIPVEEADLSAFLKNLEKLACCMALILTYYFSIEVHRPENPETAGKGTTVDQTANIMWICR